MSFFKRLVRKINDTYWRYILHKSHVRIVDGAKFRVGKNVKISNCNIYLDRNSSLILENNVTLENIDITILNGHMHIGYYSSLSSINKTKKAAYIITTGNMIVLDHTQMQLDKAWIRFGGSIKIGRYTNINRGSELRSDESVTIGDYVSGSYNLRIWDTNTHIIHSPEEQMKNKRDNFPNMGIETKKPITSPVKIGNNCWIGEKSTIMKGSKIGDNVIIGYNTTIIGKVIPDNKRVIQEVNLRIL